MKDLILEFVDPDGAEQKVTVEGNAFVIGRHSECDLAIRDSRLSREHVKIERFADVFTVSDLNSSNGTTFNGEPLNGCRGFEVSSGALNLGGGIEIKYSIVSDEEEEEPEAEEPKAENPSIEAAPPDASGSGWGAALLLVPLLAFFVLLVGGIGIFLLISGDAKETRARGSDDDYSSRSDRTDDLDVEDTPDSQGTPESTPTASDIAAPTPGVDSLPTTPVENGGDTNEDPGGVVDRKKEALVYSFMRKIAKNDKRPYLKTRRFTEVVGRANRYRGSSALAANIKSAASSSARIRKLAADNNLQPHFLAAAAIAGLGNSSGNVAAKAEEMVGTLDRLTIVLGNELADDALLVIAAYDEGLAGNNLKMRDRLAGLAKKNPTASSREIRTIWFLQEKGEISASQYEFALNFLAIGTIAQNPADFGVRSEALRLE